MYFILSAKEKEKKYTIVQINAGKAFENVLHSLLVKSLIIGTEATSPM